MAKFNKAGSFWSYKVLPLVYDSALSYYEVVSKVGKKLNETVDIINSIIDSLSNTTTTAENALTTANEAEDKAITADNKAEEALDSIPTKTSDLTNDSGFVNAAGAASAAPVQSVNGQTGNVVVSGGGAVDSVNGQTGDVVLNIPTKTSDLTNDSGFVTASDIPTKTSELTNDSGFVDASGASAAAPVQSVNGKTGSVLTYGTINSVSDLITAANSMGVEVPFLFNCDYQTAIALGGISASCGGIARLVAANGRLDYIIFQGSGYGTGEGAVVGRIGSANGTVDSYRRFITSADDVVGRSDFYRLYSDTQSAVSCANNTWTTIVSCVAPPGEGRCLLIATLRFASNSTGLRYGSITSSGTSTGAMSRELYDVRSALNGEYTVVKIVGCYTCVGGNTYYLRAKQTSGGSLNADFACMEIIRLPSDSYT